MNELATEQAAPTTVVPLWSRDEFLDLMRELATCEAPRLFAIVAEYGDAQDARVAGYGLAYEDRAEITSVEGGFRLKSQNAETARALLKRLGSSEVSQTHLVWLDEGEASTEG